MADTGIWFPGWLVKVCPWCLVTHSLAGIGSQTAETLAMWLRYTGVYEHGAHMSECKITPSSLLTWERGLLSLTLVPAVRRHGTVCVYVGSTDLKIYSPQTVLIILNSQHTIHFPAALFLGTEAMWICVWRINARDRPNTGWLGVIYEDI